MNNLHESLLPPSSPSSSSLGHSHNSTYSVNTKLQNENLSSFFDQVDSIGFSTDALRQAFHGLQQEQASLPSLKNYIAHSAKMQADMDNILSQARSIKLSLDSLDRDNVNNRLLPGCQENSSIDRVRIFVTNSLRVKLKGFMEDFSILQRKMREDHRDDVRRRVFALTGQIANEDVVDEMIEAGDTEKFLRKAIAEQGKGGKVNLVPTAHQIEERNASVKKLEESLLALHQIFLDMSVLVDMQGEELNDIERNMLEAMSFIRVGVEDIGDAVVVDAHRRKTRRWVICILILGILILICVTVLLIIFLL